MNTRPRRSLIDRFNEKWEPEPNTGCWLWTGATGSHDYGDIGTTGRAHELAHRVSYELFVGPIPPGLFVLHRCDTHPCVNHEHLFVGTHADNMADMMRKGRHWSQRSLSA